MRTSWNHAIGNTLRCRRMRPGILLLPLAVFALSCGGSSSETPWPAEPEGPALGPAGEGAPSDAPTDEAEPPADEGAPEDRGPSGEPSQEAPPPGARP